MRTRYATASIIAVAGAFGFAACGGDDTADPVEESLPPIAASADAVAITPPSAEITAAAGTPGASANFNDADVAFAQGMIPHHEQAVAMADIALDASVEAGDQVRDLANRIEAAQDPEIELMTGWLTDWGQPVTIDASDGHDMSGMDGMMSSEEMDALGSASGADFDEMWMEMMIRHHEGAIAMAETAMESGSNPEVLVLADQIIEAQQAEIDEMQTLLDA